MWFLFRRGWLHSCYCWYQIPNISGSFHLHLLTYFLPLFSDRVTGQQIQEETPDIPLFQCIFRPGRIFIPSSEFWVHPGVSSLWRCAWKPSRGRRPGGIRCLNHSCCEGAAARLRAPLMMELLTSPQRLSTAAEENNFSCLYLVLSLIIVFWTHTLIFFFSNCPI